MTTSPLVYNTSRYNVMPTFHPKFNFHSTLTASPFDDNPLHSNGTIHIRRDAAPRVYFFSSSGDALCIVDAPLEDWFVFLQVAGYSIENYNESSIVPHLKRCDVINELLRDGKIHVNTEASMYPWESPLLLLEKTRIVMGCAELGKEGLWDTSLCCEECHDEGLITFVLEDQREARVCCVAEKLLGDYGPGKVYEWLPEHED